MSQEPPTPEPGAVKIVMRTILLIWSFMISVYIFYATCKVMPLITHDQTAVTKPMPPPALALASIEKSMDAAAQKKILDDNEQAIAAYTKAVSAYVQAAAAYKSQMDNIVKSPQLNAYEAIVNGTLGTFFNTFIVAFLGYVFAKAGSRVVDNAFRMKHELPPQPIELL